MSYPVRGATYTVTGQILNTSGVPITASLTDLAGQVSITGGAFATSANTPSDLGSGVFSLVLATTETNDASTIAVKVTCSNADAATWTTLLNVGMRIEDSVIPTDTLDVRNGGYCSITGAFSPASGLTRLPNGKRVLTRLGLQGDRW